MEVTDALNPDGRFTLSHSRITAINGGAIAEGTHTVYLQVWSTEGQLLAVQEVFFTLDTTAAVPTFVDNDSRTQDTTPTLTGSAEPGAIVRLYQGTQLVGEGTADGFGDWAVTTTALSDGTGTVPVTLTARATDLAGNVSSAATIALTIDNDAPSTPTQVSLTDETDSGKSRADGLTRVDTPSIAGQAEANALIQVFDQNEQFLGEAVADASGHWQVDLFDPLPSGLSTLHTVAMDAAGNVSSASQSLAVMVDKQPSVAPTDLALLPASDSGVSNSDRLTQERTVLVAGKATPSELVQLFDGTKFMGETFADDLGNWQVAVPLITEGTHSLVAVSYDAAANQTAPSTPLVVQTDTTPPDLSILSLYNNTAWTVGDRLSGSVRDAGQPITDLVYQIRAANASNPVVNESVTRAADGSFTVPLALSSLTVGQAYVLTALATDAAGNLATRTFNFQVANPTPPPSINPGSPNEPLLNSYGDRLRIMVDAAIDAASGNTKVALTQARSGLLAVGDVVQTSNFQAGMAGVMQGLFTQANQPMTVAQSQAAGQAFAAAVASAESPIAEQLMQAKLLATAAHVPELRSQLPSDAVDTPLASALKQLATTYLETRSTPTQMDSNAYNSPNLLTRIWGATFDSGLRSAAATLQTELAGVTAPAQAIAMVDRLLRGAQQIPTVQAQVRDDSLTGGLVKLGLAYARLNPTQVADAALLEQLPLQKLWQATETTGRLAAVAGVTDLFTGFNKPSEQRDLVDAAVGVLDRLRSQGPELGQGANPVDIHNAVAAGKWMIAPTSLLAGVNQASGAVQAPPEGNQVPVIPLNPRPGTAPYVPFSEFGKVPMDSLFEPDGRPKPAKTLLEWQLQVPASHYAAGPRKPDGTNTTYSFGFYSYGGIQVKKIEMAGGFGTPIHLVVYLIVFNQDGSTREIRREGPEGSSWEPKWGYGKLKLLRKINDPTPIPGGGLLGVGGAGQPSDPYQQLPDPSYVPLPQGFIAPPLPESPRGAEPVAPGGQGTPGDSSGQPSGQPGNFSPYPSNSGVPNDPDEPVVPQPDPPDSCDLRPVPTPIAQMDYFQALVAALERVPCLVTSSLKQQLDELVKNPTLLGFLALILAVVILLSATPAGAVAVSLLNAVGIAAGVADLVQGAIQVFQAKQANNETLLNEAAKSFARALENLGPTAAEKLKLFERLGQAVTGLERLPSVGPFVRLFNLVGMSGFLRVLQQGKVQQLAGLANKFEALAPEVRAAYGAGFQKHPKSLERVLDAGSGVIDDLNTILTKYKTNPETLMNLLSKPGMSISELQELLALKGMTPELVLKLLDEEKMSIDAIKRTFKACFVAGTKILTTEGKKNIEEIRVGDWVIADDPMTPGDIHPRQVLDTYVRHTSELFDLYIDGEVISTTGEHPFWVPGKGWVKAKDLQVGTILQTEDGKIIDVDGVAKREGSFTVYNLNVDNFHTYYVSDLEILVHNADYMEWKPSMTKAEASIYTKGSYYDREMFYHTTSVSETISTQGIDPTKFDPYSNYGPGFYVGRTPHEPSAAAQGKILRVRLNVKNPKIFSDETSFNLAVEEYRKTNNLSYEREPAEVFSEFLRKQGYDAIEISQKGYVKVYERTQVVVIQ